MSNGIVESQAGRAPGPVPSGQPRARWSYNWVTVVVIVGLVVTAGLTVASAELAASNESHLLKQRAREVGSLVTSITPDIQTPLGASVALANIIGADTPRLRQFVSQYVGLGHSFVSLSVWRVGQFDKGPVTVFGATPELPQSKAGAPSVLRTASKRTELSVHGLLHEKFPRLAYVYRGAQLGRYVVEAESAVAADRYRPFAASSAYSNVNAVVYIGKIEPSRLLLKTVHTLPLRGRIAWTTEPFGGDSLIIGVSAKGALGGDFPELMPWIIAILGSLLTVGAAVLTYRLISGRRRAQALADENRRLYAEQHGIAQSLQHALLPEDLPHIEGVRLAALYDAGVPGIDIGGDWYDLIPLDDDRLLLVVGDVTGRGIRAATAMASLRFAIQYAAQVETPEVFLPKLGSVRGLHEHGQLATILCLIVDLRERRVSVTSAGHLPPLMVHEGRGEFLQPLVGPPVGAYPDATYLSSTFTVPEGGTLLGFTDGLVERRGETLDVGLERLREVAAVTDGNLEGVMAQILERVRGPESVDDTAIAGIQWVSQRQPV